MTKGGWFFEENLLPFLIILSRIASYDLQTYDWDAISFGVTGTSEQDDQWFTYEFDGKIFIPFKLARNSEDNYMIIYSLTVPEELEKSVDLMNCVLGDFDFAPRHFKVSL